MIAKPRRILVRFPNPLGDAVMATPVLRALRRAHPEADAMLESMVVLAARRRGLLGYRFIRRRVRAGIGVALVRRAVRMMLACVPHLASEEVGVILDEAQAVSRGLSFGLSWRPTASRRQLAVLSQALPPWCTRRRREGGVLQGSSNCRPRGLGDCGVV